MRVHDLSYPIHTGMSTYPAAYHPTVKVEPLASIASHGRESRRITIGTHSGTHIDAASHFIDGGRTIDHVPLDELCGTARIIRFPHSGKDRVITATDILTQLGSDRPSRLIVRYDWSDRWGSDEFYAHYPYLSEDACQFIVESGIRVFASDSPSPDDPRHSGPSCHPDSPNHKRLLGAGVSLVEYLTNLAAIEGDTIELIALPLAVRGGDGAPARVVALEP